MHIVKVYKETLNHQRPMSIFEQLICCQSHGQSITLPRKGLPNDDNWRARIELNTFIYRRKFCMKKEMGCHMKADMKSQKRQQNSRSMKMIKILLMWLPVIGQKKYHPRPLVVFASSQCNPAPRQLHISQIHRKKFSLKEKHLFLL